MQQTDVFNSLEISRKKPLIFTVGEFNLSKQQSVIIPAGIGDKRQAIAVFRVIKTSQEVVLTWRQSWGKLQTMHVGYDFI